MPQILIIVGWLFAFGCLLYLAVESLKISIFAAAPKQARTGGDKITLAQSRRHLTKRVLNFPRGVGPFGYVLLVLWEGYWILDVADRFAKAATPLKSQLPYYFFLLFVTVGIPLAAYLAARRLLRRSVSSPSPTTR